MSIEHGPQGLAIIGERYESKEFLVSTGTTNYDVKSTQTMFVATKVPQANHVAIRTDAEITVRFNSTGQDPITVPAGESLQTHQLVVTNIYITNASGGDANIKILIS